MAARIFVLQKIKLNGTMTGGGGANGVQVKISKDQSGMVVIFDNPQMLWIHYFF